MSWVRAHLKFTLLLAFLVTLIAEPGWGGESIPIQVQGRLIGDTVWQASESPYMIVGDLVIPPEVILTIEPGVTVLFSETGPGGYSPAAELEVQGTLMAIGTEDMPINFFPEKQDATWGGITFEIPYGGKGSILQNVHVRNGKVKIKRYGKVTVAGSKFCSGGLEAESPISLEIHNSIFRRNSTGLKIRAESEYTKLTPSISVIGNDFTGNGIGISLYTYSGNNFDVKIEASLFRGNEQGLEIARDGFNPVAVARNTFLRNGVGLSLAPYNSTSSLQVKNNNFLLSDRFNVLINWVRVDLDGKSCNLSNNWWGTTDPALIVQSIYDQEDDFKLMPVIYKPFLESPAASTLLQGDVNRDSKVDFRDLTLLARAYDSHWDDPISQGRYNLAADFNIDGWVNLLDLVILDKNYQRALPI